MILVTLGCGCAGKQDVWPSCEPSCTAIDDVPVDPAAQTSLGFSWEILAADTGVEERHETTLGWLEPYEHRVGETTDLVVDVTPDEPDAHLVTYACDFAKCEDGFDYPDPYTETRLERAATLSFSTGDGAFDEAWAVRLFSIDVGLVESEYVRVDGADLRGDVREQLGLGADEKFSVSVFVSWGAAGTVYEGFHGSVAVHASRYEPPPGEEGDSLAPMGGW
jgi:hypothetical protein